MVRVVEVGGCEIPLDSQTAGSAVHPAVVVLRSELSITSTKLPNHALIRKSCAGSAESVQGYSM